MGVSRTQVTSSKAARKVSIARAAACFLRAGNPSRALAISSFVSREASSISIPLIISVSAEPQASVGGQPYARKRAASILSSTMRSVRRRRSPQTGLVSSATASALGNSPAFRGLVRWSLSLAEYGKIGFQVQSPRCKVERMVFDFGPWTLDFGLRSYRFARALCHCLLIKRRKAPQAIHCTGQNLQNVVHLFARIVFPEAEAD